MNRCSLGLGGVMAWLWLFYLSGPFFTGIVDAWGERGVSFIRIFMGVHAIAFILWGNRSDCFSLRERRIVVWSGCAGMSLGTLLVLFIPPAGLGNYLAASMSVALASIGGAGVVLEWGRAMSGFEVRRMAISFSLACLYGTVIFFAAANIPQLYAPLAAVSLPLLSAFLLAGFGQPEAVMPPMMSRQFPFPGRLVALILLVYLAGGAMYKIILSSAQTLLPDAYWLSSALYCLGYLIAGAGLYRVPGLDLGLLYRCSLALLTAGFMLFAPLGASLKGIALVLWQFGFAFFDYYTWLLFLYLGTRCALPGYAIGWGMCLITGAIFCGELLAAYLTLALPRVSSEADLISTGTALLLILTYFTVRGEKETFAGWHSRQMAAAPLAPGAETAAVLAADSLVESQPEADNGFLAQLPLTAREKEVAALLLRGRNNPYIRETLNISDNTLKSHIRNIYQKLAIRSRQDLLSLHETYNSKK
ncbi:MAG: LuxR family transcriptional regulator [Negativicutes bacterium]|nr:LuxR family transcriptional regulator [Negativicutes bacterium]